MTWYLVDSVRVQFRPGLAIDKSRALAAASWLSGKNSMRVMLRSFMRYARLKEQLKAGVLSGVSRGAELEHRGTVIDNVCCDRASTERQSSASS